jgi:hypothetical protein
MEREFGAHRKKSEELTQYHKDLGASVQRITEELIFHILNHLQNAPEFHRFVLQEALRKIQSRMARSPVTQVSVTFIFHRRDMTREFQWDRPFMFTIMY